VIFSHNKSGFPSTKAAHKQATPQLKNVAQNNHFFPVFIMMYIAMAIAGISTKPASA
jgi:hypothetical protein